MIQKANQELKIDNPQTVGTVREGEAPAEPDECWLGRSLALPGSPARISQRRGEPIRPLVRRTVLFAVWLAALFTYGCAGEHEARVRREIEEYEKTHRVAEAAAPSNVTAGKSGYPVNDRLQLEIGMNRSDVEKLLPRSPDDPPDASSGMYGVAIRRLGDGAVSLTFREAKLSSLAISRRYSPAEASKYRAWLEKQYGVPKIDGNRMSWTEDPSRSVLALFQSDGSGYRVQTTLYNAATEKDMKSGEEPGTRPFETPNLPGSDNLTIGR